MNLTGLTRDEAAAVFDEWHKQYDGVSEPRADFYRMGDETYGQYSARIFELISMEMYNKSPFEIG